jgi:hypothetical protein
MQNFILIRNNVLSNKQKDQHQIYTYLYHYIIHHFKHLQNPHNQITSTLITSTKSTKQIAPRVNRPSNQRFKLLDNPLSLTHSNPMDNIIWIIIPTPS